MEAFRIAVIMVNTANFDHIFFHAGSGYRRGDILYRVTFAFLRNITGIEQ